MSDDLIDITDDADREEIEFPQDDELGQINKRLRVIKRKIIELESEKRSLEKRSTQLTEEKQKKECERLLSQDWDKKKFPWSDRMDLARKEIFGLEKYRPDQLSVMNATMSGHDCILIMPTGGGKSLTYQLPAVISEGVTLVVSPLLSLMEDQLMSLKRLEVNAAMLTGTSDQETKKNVMKDMLDPKSNLRLLYVTPEKCSKSKQFMAKLQKMHQLGRFKRLAIDEVHCCSQWGHDFRPDYKFLGAMRAMFSDVPILGLTATSTVEVTKDVKNILRIPQAMVFMSGFNRPNLHYSVRLKPDAACDNFDYIASLLKGEFDGQSGIIYTTTIKEVQNLYEELKKRNIRCGPYHAQMEVEARSRVHRKWTSGDLKVVVATIAFGMGIDKPDVRFVIHNTISRSMENFYQESGRAGRDNERATCILLFRMADIFKQSTMVFTEQTGIKKLYSMVDYCLSGDRCRRSIIAQHFSDSSMDQTLCQGMCDHCDGSSNLSSDYIDITDYAKAANGILEAAGPKEIRITAVKLVEALQGKGANNVKLKGWTGGNLNKDQVEQVVAWLLVHKYLQEDMHYTPYNVISYLASTGKHMKNLKMKFIGGEGSSTENKIVQKPLKRKRVASFGGSSSDDELIVL